MPAMKKRKADGPVVVNVDTSAPRRTYKKKGTYARRAVSNWKKFSALKPWADFGAMRYPRGTAEGVQRFGATYADATPEQRTERAQVGWRGRGLYTGSGSYNPAKNFRRWATGAFANTGRGAGRSINNSLITGLDTAGAIGNAYLGAQGAMYAGGGLYTGSGMYDSNSLVDGMAARPSMQFSSPNDESQSLILTHKEFVGDVFGPDNSGFNVTAYPLQPGLSTVFPFLAQFAQNFDEYEMIQMVWEFHSTVDANASTNASGNTGTVIMATNYKADSNLFANKDEMIQYHGGISGRLTEPLIHGVECDENKLSGNTGKYVRTVPIPFTDIKSYDIGIFQLAFQNTPPTFLNQQVGELWVYYTVKLSKPKLFSALGNAVTSARFLMNTDVVLTTMVPTTGLLKAQSNSFAPSIKSSVAGTSNAQRYTTVASGASGATADIVSTTGVGVTVTFPASISGVFELRMTIEYTGTVSAAADWIHFIGKAAVAASGNNPATPFVSNNIRPWFDIYATNSASGDAPFFMSSVISANTAVLVCRVKVASATSGVDNSLNLYPFTSSGTVSGTNPISQWALEIHEIGNIYQTDSTTNAPRYLDYTTNVLTTVLVA